LLQEEAKMIELPLVAEKWAQPPAALISKLDRGKGVKLDYLGHADTTLALIDVDPEFTYDYARDERGRMDVYEMGSNWVLEGTVTVHGVTRPCVGTCEKRKAEVHKELLGDLLRNGAMRFGIATALWSKLDDATDAHFAKPAEPTPLSTANLAKFDAACTEAGLSPAAVMGKAFPSGRPEPLLDIHLPVMRDAFKQMKAAVADVADVSGVHDVQRGQVGDEPEHEPEPEVTLASDAQVKKIQILMGEAGIKDRVARLEYIRKALGLESRPASTKNLSRQQAHTLIEYMESDARPAEQGEFDGLVES
jgi:hypothetical protein